MVSDMLQYQEELVEWKAYNKARVSHTLSLLLTTLICDRRRERSENSPGKSQL